MGICNSHLNQPRKYTVVETPDENFTTSTALETLTSINYSEEELCEIQYANWLQQIEFSELISSISKYCISDPIKPGSTSTMSIRRSTIPFKVEHDPLAFIYNTDINVVEEFIPHSYITIIFDDSNERGLNIYGVVVRHYKTYTNRFPAVISTEELQSDSEYNVFNGILHCKKSQINTILKISQLL